jgi:hypothetical protein
MAGRGRKKPAKRRWSDPSQLALFDANDGDRAGAGPSKAKQSTPKPRSQRKLATEGAVVLNPREAAIYLNVSISTLKSWRAKKIGPAWRKRGARLISYFPADLDAFLAGATCPARDS